MILHRILELLHQVVDKPKCHTRRMHPDPDLARVKKKQREISERVRVLGIEVSLVRESKGARSGQ